MSTIQEVKDRLKEGLEAQGRLNEIRALLRSQIYHSLEPENSIKPKLNSIQIIINELIRDYMMYNGYKHSLSVFMTGIHSLIELTTIKESDQPNDSNHDRKKCAEKLNLQDLYTENPQIPLLYGIVASLLKDKKI